QPLNIPFPQDLFHLIFINRNYVLMQQNFLFKVVMLSIQFTIYLTYKSGNIEKVLFAGNILGRFCSNKIISFLYLSAQIMGHVINAQIKKAL
ncbi:MAG: hypothetical protein ABIO04_09700, partial [Ferruginibacter sp.]